MNCEDIYKLAMAFIAESDNDDFKARCLSFIDAFNADHVYLNLNGSERLSTACALYVAAALVENGNRELAKTLTDKYKESIKQIKAEIPAEITSITNLY